MKPKPKILSPPPHPVSPAARRKRWRRRLACGVGIYAVIGFLVLPAILKWQLRKQLPALTQRQTEVQQVRMNPFALSLTIRGFALTETNGAAFVAFDEFYANFQLSSLFRWAWTFREIRLVHPTANLVRRTDGSFNFSNLLSTNAPATNAPAPPPPLLIQSLHITNAVIAVTDHTTPRIFQTTYGPIDIAFQNFNTHRAKEEPYSFVATTSDGETFAWSGDFSLNQLRSAGTFKLAGIPPGKYEPYLALFSTVRLQRGALAVGATYRLNAARVPLELEVTGAYMELRDLLVKPPDRDLALLAIARLLVTNTTASLTGQVARIGSVSIDGGSVFLERATNGQPVALGYLLPPPANPASPAKSPAPPWRFDLAEFCLTNFNVAWEDHSAASVAEIGLDDLALNLRGLSNQSNAPVDLNLALNWRGGGAVQVAAQGTLLPPAITSQIAISNLAIPPVQPYLGQFLNLVVHSGELNVHGTANFDPAGAPQLRFKGDLSVTNFSSSDTVAYHEFARWEEHSVRGIDLSLHPHRLTIEEIKFVGARNNIMVSSNGQLNVAALVKLPAPPNTAAAPPPAATAATAAAPELFPIQVGAVVLERNSFRAGDDTLLRRFETHIEEINGSIRGLVLPGLNKAAVDIRGKVSSLAPFEVIGAVTPDPQNLFVDLKVAFTNTDLTSLSPYLEKFVGRPLTRGKLTTELKYHVENRQLTAANLVNLDQLTLGARTESPFATKLPVKLAIGLLKDLDGRIALDLPLSGQIDDPDFSLWGLVGQTMQNLILRVATSPFSLLGALAGGGEELQFVDFAPGAVTWNDGQTNKLMKLAEALGKRPALTLEISATFDPDADVAALGEQKVAARMKRARIEEIIARGKPAPALAELQLDENEYERLLRKAYRAEFNTTPEQALFEKLSATLVTNANGAPVAPAPAKGGTQKGAAVLLGFNKSLTQLAAAASPNAGAPAQTKPKSEKELVREELEHRLATLAPVTPDEIRALMQQRIELVQKFLLEQAGVAGQRLLPAAPNPEDPNRRGPARVVFALE